MSHPDISNSDLEDVKDVFDLFDFWDGRDGLIDAFKLGDMLRCTSLNPTMETIRKHGGTKKSGEKQYKFEECLAAFIQVNAMKDIGTFADYNEAFRTADREGQGFISLAEMRHMLTALGDRLTDQEMDDILTATDTTENLDGNIKYADFIAKVLKGHAA